jgi:hypothetical protein
MTEGELRELDRWAGVRWEACAELDQEGADALNELPRLLAYARRMRDERDQFEAVLQQVVFSLERNDPGRTEGRIPMKADWEVALSMAKAALGHAARTKP